MTSFTQQGTKICPYFSSEWNCMGISLIRQRQKKALYFLENFDFNSKRSGGTLLHTFQKCAWVCKVRSWQDFCTLFFMKCRLCAYFMHTFFKLFTLFLIDNPLSCTLFADFLQTLCRQILCFADLLQKACTYWA